MTPDRQGYDLGKQESELAAKPSTILDANDVPPTEQTSGGKSPRSHMLFEAGTGRPRDDSSTQQPGNSDSNEEEKPKTTWRARTSRLISGRVIAPVVILLAVFVAVWLLQPLTLMKAVPILALAGLFVYEVFLQKYFDKTVDRPPPIMGKPKMVHLAARRAGLTYVPPRSTRELIEIEGASHFELMQDRSVVVGVYGPKGGVGKTPTVVGMSWFASYYNKVPNLLLDAREKRGHLAECIGLWRRSNHNATQPHPFSTPTIRQMITMNEEGWFDTATQTFDLMGSAEGRMLHVGASDNLLDGKQLSIGVERLVGLIRRERKHYKLIMFECSDVLNTAIDRGLMGEVDIPIFIHRVNMVGSDGETIQGLSVYEQEFGAKIRQHGIMFVLAAKKGQTSQEFSRKFGGIIPPERTFLIDFDTYFEHGETDEGHDFAAQRDLSRRPRQTRVLDDSPESAVLQWMRGLNTGLRTVPVTVQVPALKTKHDTHVDAVDVDSTQPRDALTRPLVSVSHHERIAP